MSGEPNVPGGGKCLTFVCPLHPTATHILYDRWPVSLPFPSFPVQPPQQRSNCEERTDGRRYIYPI